MIKAMGITIALTVIRATVAMEATTTLGTTIPTMDMGRDTQITVVSGFALIPDNKSTHPFLERCSYSAHGSKDEISWCAAVCKVSFRGWVLTLVGSVFFPMLPPGQQSTYGKASRGGGNHQNNYQPY